MARIGRKGLLGLFAGAAIVLAVSSIASACSLVTPGGYFEVTPPAGDHPAAVNIRVAGVCDLCGFSAATGNKDLWLSATTFKVLGGVGVRSPLNAQSGGCGVGAPYHDIGSVTVLPPIGPGLTVNGQGTIDPAVAPTPGVYMVCAGPDPQHLWNFFTYL